MCKGISARFAQQKILRKEFATINQKINLKWQYFVTNLYGVLCKYASNGCIILTTSDLVHANEDMLRILGK